MATLSITLTQVELDILNEIATEAKDSRFANAQGMVTLRLKQEVRERRITKDVVDARKTAEARY